MSDTERIPAKPSLTVEDIIEMVSLELRARRGQESWRHHDRYRCFRGRSNDELEAVRSVLLDIEEHGKDPKP